MVNIIQILWNSKQEGEFKLGSLKENKIIKKNFLSPTHTQNKTSKNLKYRRMVSYDKIKTFNTYM